MERSAISLVVSRSINLVGVKTMCRKKFSKLLLLVSFFLLLFIVFAGAQIWTFSKKNQLIKSDAAIVLGAAVWNDEPSPVFRERINHAIWLYEKGYVDKLIFTGGKADEHTRAEAEVAKEYAKSRNVNEDDMLLETKSTITEENLQYAKILAERNRLTSFTIVSDPLHMKRAVFIAEELEMNVFTSPTPSTAYESFETKLPFFIREWALYLGYLISSPFRNMEI